jgi:predicted DNA-binding ribbon-helix-helix protein
MNPKTDTIEVDKETADTLKARAAERGISVAELLAEIASENGPVVVTRLSRRARSALGESKSWRSNRTARRHRALAADVGHSGVQAVA